MITLVELEEMLIRLRAHAASLVNDVEQASTREEHIRLSMRANEAENLVERAYRILVEESSSDA